MKFHCCWKLVFKVISQRTNIEKKLIRKKSDLRLLECMDHHCWTVSILAMKFFLYYMIRDTLNSQSGDIVFMQYVDVHIHEANQETHVEF